MQVITTKKNSADSQRSSNLVKMLQVEAGVLIDDWKNNNL